MNAIYPVANVVADSENTVSTDGPNSLTGGVGLTTEAGRLLTDADASCALDIVDRYGRAVLSNVMLDYVSPGVWKTVLPASIPLNSGATVSVFPTRLGPWVLALRVLSADGTMLLRTFYALAREGTG